MGFVVVALILAVSSIPAAAQPGPGCDALLAAAHDHYVNQQFADAERAVHDCLARATAGSDEALGACRLLALVHLRRDELAEAKRVVLRLLGDSSDYAPDPILDPPSYVALVETIRAQLRVAAEEASASVAETHVNVPPSTRPSTSIRTGRSVHVGL